MYKSDKELADLLRTNDYIRLISKDSQSGVRSFVVTEFESYKEMADLVRDTGITEPEKFQEMIATLEEIGVIEVIRFDLETGRISFKSFIPSTLFNRN